MCDMRLGLVKQRREGAAGGYTQTIEQKCLNASTSPALGLLGDSARWPCKKMKWRAESERFG